MKKFIRCVIIMMALCLASAPAWALRIVLEGGQVIEGEIVDYTDEYVKIQRGDQSVLKIRFSSMGPLSAERLRKYIKELEAQKPVLAPDEDPNQIFSQAAALAKEGKLVEALKLFDRAVYLDPQSGKFLFFRGNLYVEMKNFQKAVEDYKAAIALRPDKTNVWIKLAETYMLMERFADAVSAYDQVLDLTPNDLSVVLDRANAHWKNGNLGEAVYDYTTVLKRDKSNGFAYARRAKMYYDQKEYRLAWKDVYSAHEAGFRPPDAFIQKLQEVMPDPFREKTLIEKVQQAGDWVVQTARNYSTLFAVAGAFFVFGVAMLLIMLLKTSHPKLRHAAETAERLEREEIMESAKSVFETGDFKQASLAKRGAAFLIDAALLIAASCGIDFVLGSTMFFVWFGILFLLRDLWGARSPGKRIVGLVVVNEFGYRGAFWENLVRNFFLAFISCLSFLVSADQNVLRYVHRNIGIIIVVIFLLIEALCLLMRKDRFRVGDIMATTCVHDRHPRRGSWMFALLNIVLLAGLGAGAYWGYQTGRIELAIKPYYTSDQFKISFRLPWGWDLKEDAGSIILEKKERSALQGLPEATIMISRDEDMALFSLEQAFEAFKNYVTSMGLAVVHEKDETLPGGMAAKIFISADMATQDAIVLGILKQFDYGPLYIFQCNVKLPKFKDVASVPFLNIVESLRFLEGKPAAAEAGKK